jgi:hypothetical protein
MPNINVKGQEGQLRFIKGGEIVDVFTNVRSWNMHSQMSIISTGYIGEKTNRRDEIYNGTKGSCVIHFNKGSIFTRFRELIDRAKKQISDFKVNAVFIMNFADGTTKKILVPDIKFGEIPLSFGARENYGEITLDFEAEDWQEV